MTHWLWLDPRFGASGDMMLGALVGLGADVDEIEGALRSEFDDLAPWSIHRHDTERASLSACRVEVKTEDSAHHRSWSVIDQRLARSGLAPAVVDGARGSFRRLGEAEAAIHRVDIDQVHFHEVGAADAIIDIVGSWLALDRLAVDEVVVGPVGLGSGTVQAAHGLLPVPAPATAALLAGAPIVSLAAEGESVTPTGAALLVSMADRWGGLPGGVLVRTARGAGGRDPSGHPNVLTAHLGRHPSPEAVEAGAALTAARSGAESGGDGLEHQVRTLIATNIDDVTPETVAHVIERCLGAGADDAWATPIVMKKGRPAVELNVLVRQERTGELIELVMAETGTLGVRLSALARRVAARRVEAVVVRGETIRIKVGPHGAKPEYDDLVASAHRLDLPLRLLSAEAIATWLGTR